jgi:hypothetical protein
VLLPNFGRSLDYPRIAVSSVVAASRDQAHANHHRAPAATGSHRTSLVEPVRAVRDAGRFGGKQNPNVLRMKIGRNGAVDLVKPSLPMERAQFLYRLIGKPSK